MKAFLSNASSKTGHIQRILRASFHVARAKIWRSESRQRAQPVAEQTKMQKAQDYKEWSHESLIERITQLEKELREKNTSFKEPALKIKKKHRPDRIFDPSIYSTRLIALKLAYLGKNYNGFEFHANNNTPLPTIEEELWKALTKSRLILPKDTNPLQPGEVNWEVCEYSKCGRTDKGVSAFGQVIGIRVRSNRPLKKKKNNDSKASDADTAPLGLQINKSQNNDLEIASPNLSASEDDGRETAKLDEEDCDEALSFNPITDELQYHTILNHLLPPDIRILAWCPEPPVNFSARFYCKERQYKYFFTQPAFPPIPSHLEAKTKGAFGKHTQDGWLDIDAMREAAKKYVGLHDFRNFCKVDASKQISNFERRIFHADIVEEDVTGTLDFVNGAGFFPDESQKINGLEKSSRYPKVFSFTLHGSAFLWHQVRHMVAVLFLVGQGLESPSIVSELLDIEKCPRRPTYEMASDAPLVLWNCIFPREGDEERRDAMDWLYVGDEVGSGDNKYGSAGLVEDLWSQWRERKIDEVLAGKLVDVATSQGKELQSLVSNPRRGMHSQRVFDGGNTPRLQGVYLPVMKKLLMDSVETINDRYAVRKGFESAKDMKEQGLLRVKKPLEIADTNGD